MENIITQAMLEEDLRKLGVESGDTVYVHSSMKAVGWMEDGAQTLLRAFLKVLGPEGTVAVPTHCGARPAQGTPPYDRAHSRTGLGAFAEAVRTAPGAYRSGHATHSSAALGKNARWLTEAQSNENPMAPDSPLDRLTRIGGKTMLIGVTHTANTAIHLAESRAGVPYVRSMYYDPWGEETWVKNPDGSVTRYVQTEFPGCSENFDVLAEDFEKAGIVRRGKLGNADVLLMDSAAMVDLAVERIRQEPLLVLCDDPECVCCPNRYKIMRENPWPGR